MFLLGERKIAHAHKLTQTELRFEPILKNYYLKYVKYRHIFICSKPVIDKLTLSEMFLVPGVNNAFQEEKA